MNPFAKAESANGDEDERGEQDAVERGDKDPAGWQPGRRRTERVGDVGSNDETGAGHDADAEQPEIPGNDESGELVEAELRPLVEAAL